MFIIRLTLLLLTLGKSYSLCDFGQKPKVSTSSLLQKCFKNLEECSKGIAINVEDCEEYASTTTTTTLSPKNFTSLARNSNGV